MSGPLVVLWEDAHGLAVSKPAGLLTQGPPGGRSTLESLVRAYLRPDDPLSVYLGTVHRLDRPVSGVVLWAKTLKAARRWAEQFAGRSARKEYWAIVELGAAIDPIPASGSWDDRLSPLDPTGQAHVVTGSEGVRALTQFEVEVGNALPKGLAWLKLRPETGRTHQLRVQSAARGMPIVGDATYGATRTFPEGIALHARSLTVEHPIVRRPMVVEAPLPASWANWPG